MTRSALITALILVTLPVCGQDWPHYGSDAGGSRYSALQQVNRDNVGRLEQVWLHRSGDLAGRAEIIASLAIHETTPILLPYHAGGALVYCTAFDQIIALDPATGSERWRYDPQIVTDIKLPYACRGVAAWHDAQAGAGDLCASRILSGTQDGRLFALDAFTGQRCPDFGEDGEVQMVSAGEVRVIGEVQMKSAPAIIGDIAIIGSTVRDNISTDNPSGKVRAYHARTGTLAWEWDPVPRDPEDPAVSSWGNDSWKTTGGANVYAPISVDPDRDMVVVATSSPAVDHFGGNRPGDNRYTNSVVALDGKTGIVIWHFQITHHDLWNFDVAPQPILTDLPLGPAGSLVPAVVQNTKQGFVFVLHRETGEPLLPVEERPVPQSDVPGEHTSPTQPFPVRPPPLSPISLTEEDAFGILYFDKRACRKKIAGYRNEGMYTPPSLRGTIMQPSAIGGVNWSSGAIHPDKHIMVVNTNRIAQVVRLKRRGDIKLTRELFDADFSGEMPREPSPQFGTPYEAEFEPLLSQLGIPCTPPPWGALHAVDLVKGEIVWEQSFGTLEALLPVPIPIRSGTPNIGGPIITGSGLIFIAATMDERIRAYDMETGKELWSDKLPAGGQATPMTYLDNGRQYIVIAAGGHGMMGTRQGDYIVAYALP